MLEWYLHLASLTERNKMAKTLDDMLYTIAEYEPMDDDYSYLDEPEDHPFLQEVRSAELWGGTE